SFEPGTLGGVLGGRLCSQRRSDPERQSEGQRRGHLSAIDFKHNAVPRNDFAKVLRGRDENGVLEGRGSHDRRLGGLSSDVVSVVTTTREKDCPTPCQFHLFASISAQLRESVAVLPDRKLGRGTMIISGVARFGAVALIAIVGAGVASAEDAKKADIDALRQAMAKYDDPYVAVRDLYLSTVGCVYYDGTKI